MLEFYPSIEYNKAKRVKFIVLFILAVLVIGATMVACFTLKKILLVFISAFFLIFAIMLFPSVIKSYPTKKIPLITIGNKEIVCSGNTLRLTDIVSVRCIVLYYPQGKISPEIADEMEKKAKDPFTEPYLGNIDITVKGEKTDRVIYTTVEDCVGALQGLIDFGVKDYELFFNYKKQTIKSEYRFIRNSNETIQDISKKERRKQLL